MHLLRGSAVYLYVKRGNTNCVSRGVCLAQQTLHQSADNGLGHANCVSSYSTYRNSLSSHPLTCTRVVRSDQPLTKSATRGEKKKQKTNSRLQTYEVDTCARHTVELSATARGCENITPVDHKCVDDAVADLPSDIENMESARLPIIKMRRILIYGANSSPPFCDSFLVQ